MTDVLLAHAFFLNRDPKQLEKMRPYPPLGTLYAAANLRRLGYSVALFDAMLSAGEHEFESLLDEHQPSVVAIYEDQFNFVNKMCLTHTRAATAVMSRMAASRGAHVVAAGSDVTDHPERYFDFGVQYALVGEPDHSLTELVGVLLGRDPRPPHRVEGVVTRHSNGDAIAGPWRRRTPEHTPDVFPFPAWDLVDVERYREIWLRTHGYFSVNMVSTRGCPYPCSWCAKPIWGQRYAMRSPANVAAEMAWLKATVCPDHIWFADDIFGLQPEWLAAFTREVERCDVRIPFMVQSRVDLMEQASVASLARAGCAEVWLGAESGSQRILDAMRKGITVAQIEAARRRLGEAGIRACFFLQFGYPGEQFEDIMATVQLVRDLLPDDIGVSVSYPLPGTRFFDAVKSQLSVRDHWDNSQDLAMLFQGTYRTPFYRKLHQTLHRDLELRQQSQGDAATDRTRLAEWDALAHDWFELGQMEIEQRSPQPTALDSGDEPLARRWSRWTSANGGTEPMADILLAHGYFLSEDEKEREIMKPYPPLGLLYLSAYLKRAGYSVEVFDTTFATRGEFYARLAGQSAGVLGLYTNLLTRRSVLDIMHQAKPHGWRVILGGPEAANYPGEYLRRGADVVVVGEGEQTLAELLPRLARDGTHGLAGVAGIVYLDSDGQLVRNAVRDLIPDLDSLPWPDRGSIDLHRYVSVWRERHGAGSLNLITARGCPYKCRWCSHAVFGDTHRRRNYVDCADELEFLHRTYGLDQVWYADDVFTINHRWLFEYAAELRRRKLRIPFETISRADRMASDEVLATLAEMGCQRIWIGSESGSQRILDAMQRGVTVEQVEWAVKAAQRHGVQVGMFLMWGYEGEEIEDIAATVEHVKQCDPDVFFTTVVYPIKSTAYFEAVADRVYLDQGWSDATDRDYRVRGRRSGAFYKNADRWLRGEVAAFRVAGTDPATAEQQRLEAQLARQAMLAELAAK